MVSGLVSGASVYSNPPVNAVAGDTTAISGGMQTSVQLKPEVQTMFNAMIQGDQQALNSAGIKHPRILQILDRIAELQKQQGVGQGTQPMYMNLPDGTQVPATAGTGDILGQLASAVGQSGGGHITRSQQEQLNAALDQLGAPPTAGATQDASVPPGGDLLGATLAVATPTGDGVSTVDPTTDGQTV